MRALIVIALLGCAPEIIGPRDTGLEGLSLTRLDPGLVLPGTLIVATGQSFVGDTLGRTRLRLHGTLGGADFDREYDVKVVSGSRIELVSDGTLVGDLDGEATIEVMSTVDRKLHMSPPLLLKLRFVSEEVPTIGDVGDGVSFVNQPVQVTGSGFLLGGGEGETHASLTGCFTPAGTTICGATTTVEVAAQPAAPFDRANAVFPWATTISGIGPGSWTGMLTLVNIHASGVRKSTGAKAVKFDIQRPAIFAASTTTASLGQYVVIQGGGFIDQVTLLELKGTFTPDGGGADRPLDLQLVTDFVAGPTVRYVLSADDPLGKIVDLRKESGVIRGTVKPIVEDDTARVDGNAIPVQLTVAHVRQVVFVNFLSSYVESLRKFGLRAADPLIRQRVLGVAARDYAATNMDFRDVEPTDFALYSTVDLAGPDPNGQGLLGYDNTPGKDTDNLRLYDHIGGANAVTEEDGSPGYGGVFTESFFGFSKHPNGLAQKLPEQNDTFDRIFDPFRPDVGGLELTAGELASLQPPALDDGASCPARDRRTQIACAVWVLGNVIGSTMTHEVGHSLGLANPYGSGYHDQGDLPNRLMEVGSARPFNERAQLGGEGPAVFCDTAYDYLRMILPNEMTPPTVDRPPCD
jgi:hypothetical protein